jgi:isochorismate synthase EntC
MGFGKQKQRQITRDDIDSFLNSGWLFGLGNGDLAVGWGQMEWVAEPPVGATVIYSPDFYLITQTPYAVTEFTTVIKANDLKRILQSYPLARRPFRNQMVNWEEPIKETFAKSFATIQEAIAKKEIEKAVPVVFAKQHRRMQTAEVLSVLERLVLLPNILRPFGIWSLTKTVQGVLGATPELLFRRFADRIETMALAGTLRRPADEAKIAAFVKDEKETREHQFVTEGIRSRLSEFGDVQVGLMGVLGLPTLIHLKTDIVVKLDPEAEFSFLDLIKTLHPTPALGTFPPEKGLGWLAQNLEPNELRAKHGAPFALIFGPAQKTLPQIEALVAIRCIQWQGSLLRMGSGCGIVAQSDLEKEWIELAAKRASVAELLVL